VPAVLASDLLENAGRPEMEIRICREMKENEVTSGEMR